jgi:hypothetical protein
MRLDRIAKGSPVSAAAVNRMAEAVERSAPGIAFGGGGGGNSFSGGFHIRRRPSLLSSGSLDLSQFAFGVTIDGATATVAAGYVLRGKRAPVAVAETQVIIEASITFIYVKYVLTTGAATVEKESTFQYPDSEAYRWTLCQFSLAAGVATLVLPVYHICNCELPGVGA